MHSVPYRPARANWIWVTTAGLTVLAASVAALRLAQPVTCLARPAAGTFSAAGTLRPAGTRPPAWSSRGAAGAAAGGGPAAAGQPSGRAGRAGRPRPGLPGLVYSGHALFYDPGRAAGSCTLGPFPARGWYASLSPRQFAHGRTCGTYLDVRGPAGTVRAEVVDLCPTCQRTTINLSRSAYNRVGDPRPGVVPVTYRWVPDPRLRHPLALHVTAPVPSERAIQVIGNGNRLVSLAVAPASVTAGAWRRLRLDRHDFWIAWNLARPGPYAVRITDVLGHRVTLPRVRLIPGTTTRTGSWLYRPARRQRARGRGRAGVAGPAPSGRGCG